MVEGLGLSVLGCRVMVWMLLGPQTTFRAWAGTLEVIDGTQWKGAPY